MIEYVLFALKYVTQLRTESAMEKFAASECYKSIHV